MAVFTQRVYLTGDGLRYVPEGHAEAAFLAHPVGAEISDRLVEARGLEAFTRPGPVHQPPSMVITTDGAVLPVAPTTGVLPAGTTPPGHATPSVPGVPAEVAPVVVANAPGPQSAAEAAAARTQANRASGKPARSREV